ncbi:MAG: DinB family protein [Gemmatimonadaceae bacterium]
MNAAQKLLQDFDQEMQTTRRLLERVPSGKGEWKPHPKSFPLGHLAQLVARMPGWIVGTIGSDSLDLASSGGYTFESTETLLDVFDKNVADASAALAAADDGDLQKNWSLKHGDKVLMSMPRGAVSRQTISHLVHHRAQLGVYLRLLDVPVPSMYGPTADEPWGA